jgi:hypothetical protein
VKEDTYTMFLAVTHHLGSISSTLFSIKPFFLRTLQTCAEVATAKHKHLRDVTFVFSLQQL